MTAPRHADDLDCAYIQNAEQLAMQEAERQDVKASVAIVTASGVLAGFVRMPGSFLATVEYAHWKAWTSASFDMPSQDFAKLVEGLDPLTRDGLLAHPKATPLPGGFPIRRDGRLIGAIGASGGSAEQDEAIAQAGLAAFNA